MDVNSLLQLITNANGTNCDDQTRIGATNKLAAMRKNVGYCSTLLRIWRWSSDNASNNNSNNSNLGITDDIKIIALIQFKNHCQSSFHKSNSDSCKEKEFCKNLLLSNYLKVENEPIMKQIAQCIAKLSRREWPAEWPQLFETLVANLTDSESQSNPLFLINTCLVLTDVLRELSSMRLSWHKQSFTELSQHLIPVLFEIWKSVFAFTLTQLQELLQTLSSSSSDNNSNNNNNSNYGLYQCLKLCQLLCDSQRILLNHSLDLDLASNSIGSQYLNQVLETIGQLHDRCYVELKKYYVLATAATNEPPQWVLSLLEMLEGILHVLLLTIRDTHKQFTLQFRFILPAFLSYYAHIITSYCKYKDTQAQAQQQQITTNGRDFIFKECIVYGLLFVRDCLELHAYQGKVTSGFKLDFIQASTKPATEFRSLTHSLNTNASGADFDAQAANECKMIVDQFFSADRVTYFLQCFIENLFILRESDLYQRRTDPLQFYLNTKIEHNNDNIRAAAKYVFKSMVAKQSAICIPYILQTFVAVNRAHSNGKNSQASVTESGALIKDSVYLSFGLKYGEIHQRLKKKQLPNGNMQLDFSDIMNILKLDLVHYAHHPLLTARILWLMGKMREDIYENENSAQYNLFCYQQIMESIKPMPQPRAENESDNEYEVRWNENLLIRLSAGQALHRLMDHRRYSPQMFAANLQNACGFLLTLISDGSDSLDVMSDVMRLLESVISKNVIVLNYYSSETNENNNNNGNGNGNGNGNEAPFNGALIVNTIMDQMHALWLKCNTTATNLIRKAIIDCMGHLVRCMTPATVHSFYEKFVGVIAYCTQTSNASLSMNTKTQANSGAKVADDRLCLVENGIELWHRVLYQSRDMTNEMNELFAQNWMNCVRAHTDLFQVLMDILSSYLYLGGSPFVQSHAQQICECLTFMVEDFIETPEMCQHLSIVIEKLCLFLQLFPQQSVQFLSGAIQALVKSFIQEMMATANRNSSSDANERQCSSMQMAKLNAKRIENYCFFFARLLLLAYNDFIQLLDGMSSAASSSSSSPNNTANNNGNHEQNSETNVTQLLFQMMIEAAAVNGNKYLKTVHKQKIVVLSTVKIFEHISTASGHTNNNNNHNHNNNNNKENSNYLPVLSVLLPWWLTVVISSEINVLQYAEDIAPTPNEDESEWNEGDRISKLFQNDLVCKVFMIDVIVKTLYSCVCKIQNITHQQLVMEIARNNNNEQLIQDWQQCLQKWQLFQEAQQQHN